MALASTTGALNRWLDNESTYIPLSQIGTCAAWEKGEFSGVHQFYGVSQPFTDTFPVEQTVRQHTDKREKNKLQDEYVLCIVLIWSCFSSGMEC